ncbi:hypothetical protein LC653_11105 [Nostoc sp. CHAB 5784]|uniref:hypothetical protein n=1 Tax=Nostoc mirabile TaxID=2907820 RepID=UPI001E3E598F|nr:hypothetical protein [Nostoc mirabile]MCC5664448.1 hypothetical protein [Nostoc mirabile CHAB5784]
MLISTYHQFPHSSSIWWFVLRLSVDQAIGSFQMNQVAIAGMAILTSLNSLG